MNDPAPSSRPASISGSALRRGRILMLIMVTMMAPMVLGLISRYDPPWLVFGALLFGGFLAWLGLRGGRIITAGYILMTGPIFVLFVMQLYGLLTQIFFPVRYWPDYIRNSAQYENPHEVALVTVVSVFSTFSLWVLLLSHDARLYRRVRRRQIVERRAAFFGWPPAGQPEV